MHGLEEGEACLVLGVFPFLHLSLPKEAFFLQVLYPTLELPQHLFTSLNPPVLPGPEPPLPGSPS